MIPCKFCGHKPDVKYSGYAGCYVVVCFNGECPVLPEVWGQTKKDAVAAWNGKAKDSSKAHIRIGAVGWSNLLADIETPNS